MINTGHLWFLVVLLVLSLLASIIFLGFNKIGKNFSGNKESSDRADAIDKRINYVCSSRFKDKISHPVLILLWASVAILLDYIPSQISFFQNNQVLFFIFGMMLAGWRMNLDQIKKHWKWSLPLGFTLLILWAVFPGKYLFYLKYIGSWYFIYGLIGVASAKFRKSSPALRYFSKASMSIYILHMPFQIIVGYYIIRLPINPILEIFLLIIINLLLCFAVYELVKRINRILPGVGLIIGIKERRNRRKKLEIPEEERILIQNI
jgi:peptidoglycan/LPS O-acetylase OafA/YrhL